MCAYIYIYVYMCVYVYALFALLHDTRQADALPQNPAGVPVCAASSLLPLTSLPNFWIEILSKAIVILAESRRDCHQAWDSLLLFAHRWGLP